MNVTVDLTRSTWREQVMAWLNSSHYGDTLIVLLPPTSRMFFITMWYEGKMCCDWGSENGWEWLRTHHLIARLERSQ